MKIKVKKMLLMMSIALIGTMTLVSCRPKDASEPPGVGQRSGAAIDRATKKTVDKSKELSETAVEKTGEVLEKAGAAVEKTGADMQK